jgi:hypothetical protein
MLSVVMLSFLSFMLCVVMLSVLNLGVVMLNVVAPAAAPSISAQKREKKSDISGNTYKSFHKSKMFLAV